MALQGKGNAQNQNVCIAAKMPFLYMFNTSYEQIQYTMQNINTSFNITSQCKSHFKQVATTVWLRFILHKMKICLFQLHNNI